MTQFTTIDIIIPPTTRTAMPFCPFCKCEIPHVGGHAFTPSRWCDSSVPLVIHPHTSLSINLVVTVSIPDWQLLRLAALHWPLLFRLLSHKKLFEIPESSHLFPCNHVPSTLLLKSHVVLHTHYTKFIPSDVDSITKPRLSYHTSGHVVFHVRSGSLDQQSIHQYNTLYPKST